MSSKDPDSNMIYILSWHVDHIESKNGQVLERSDDTILYVYPLLLGDEIIAWGAE